MSRQMDKQPKPSSIDPLECKGGEKGLVFQIIKEHRGAYFVEYLPARAGEYFSTLSLVFLEHPASSELAKLMEQECSTWIQRFPLPLFVSAFNDTGEVIHLTGNRVCDNLIGILEDGKPVYHWKLLKNEEIASGPLNESQLLDVFCDIPYSTAEERRRKAVEQARNIRMLILVIAVWGVVVAAVVGITGLANPILGVVIVIYAVGKAIYHALKMLGYIKKRESEKQKDAEELRMRHHHYHCERNPEGFTRLLVENFEREAQETTRKEAEDIKRGHPRDFSREQMDGWITDDEEGMRRFREGR